MRTEQGHHIYIGKHGEITKHFGKHEGKYYSAVKMPEDQEMLRKFLNKEVPLQVN